jgi:DNA polymerase I-like protein with 3'-5' exonuclease and polymerase domains
MEECYALKVPLVAEVKIGKNLGEMKKLETL